jgi:hypothetical protein
VLRTYERGSCVQCNYSSITDALFHNLQSQYIVTDLVNALPGNSSVNTAQHATIEEAVFSVDPTEVPIEFA